MEPKISAHWVLIPHVVTGIGQKGKEFMCICFPGMHYYFLKSEEIIKTIAGRHACELEAVDSHYRLAFPCSLFCNKYFSVTYDRSIRTIHIGA